MKGDASGRLGRQNNPKIRRSQKLSETGHSIQLGLHLLTVKASEPSSSRCGDGETNARRGHLRRATASSAALEVMALCKCPRRAFFLGACVCVRSAH